MLNCFLLLLAVVKTCIFHSNCYIHRLITSFVVHLCHFCQIVCFICFYNTSLLLLYVMGLIKIHCIHQNYTMNNTKSVHYCWLRRSLLFLVSHFIWGRRPSAIQNFIMLNCFLFLLAVVNMYFYSFCYINWLIISFVVSLCPLCQIVCQICFYNQTSSVILFRLADCLHSVVWFLQSVVWISLLKYVFVI